MRPHAASHSHSISASFLSPFLHSCLRNSLVRAHRLFLTHLLLAISQYAPDLKEDNIQFLSLQRGDIVDVLEQHESGWWEGMLNGVIGGAYTKRSFARGALCMLWQCSP